MSIVSVATIVALNAAISAAHPGDTVALKAGTYGAATIGGTPNCGSTKPGAYNVTTCVTVDLSKAVFAGVMITTSKGLNIVGPTSNNSVWYGFRFYDDSNVVLTGWHCSGGALAACVAIGNNSHDIVVSNGEASGHTGDCFDMNSVQRVWVMNNYCHDNVQIAGVSPHPDVVQIWTVNSPSGACVPTTDVTVENNRGIGNTQGIDTFGTPPACPDQRVVIENNTIETQGWWCYGLTQAVDSTLKNNTCIELKAGVVPAIDLYGGSGNTVTSNTLVPYSASTSTTTSTTTVTTTTTTPSNSSSSGKGG
jgi:hypothetical protein